VKLEDDKLMTTFSYMVPENIRYLLYQYRPQTALYFGHRYAVEQIPEGYMAGGGYILSKKALEKFVTKIIQNATICSMNENGSEDWEMGRCLQHAAISVDERDEKLGKRFFPAGIMEHLKPKKDPNYWYVKNQYYESEQGSLNCCSDTPAAFHYIVPNEMYLIEYLTQNVHPFGLEKNLTEQLPRKLTLEEILQKSDKESLSPNYRKHKIYHDIEESERVGE
jgi:glycoprotein-N-acetylgalactosamine 3-beta-galactosyltransferase